MNPQTYEPVYLNLEDLIQRQVSTYFMDKSFEEMTLEGVDSLATDINVYINRLGNIALEILNSESMTICGCKLIIGDPKIDFYNCLLPKASNIVVLCDTDRSKHGILVKVEKCTSNSNDSNFMFFIAEELCYNTNLLKEKANEYFTNLHSRRENAACQYAKKERIALLEAFVHSSELVDCTLEEAKKELEQLQE
jgi:hypothetical protein